MAAEPLVDLRVSTQPAKIRVDIHVEHIVVSRIGLIGKLPNHSPFANKITSQPFQSLNRLTIGSSKPTAKFLGCICHIWTVESEVVRSRRQSSKPCGIVAGKVLALESDLLHLFCCLGSDSFSFHGLLGFQSEDDVGCGSFPGCTFVKNMFQYAKPGCRSWPRNILLNEVEVFLCEPREWALASIDQEEGRGADGTGQEEGTIVMREHILDRDDMVNGWLEVKVDGSLLLVGLPDVRRGDEGNDRIGGWIVLILKVFVLLLLGVVPLPGRDARRGFLELKALEK